MFTLHPVLARLLRCIKRHPIVTFSLVLSAIYTGFCIWQYLNAIFEFHDIINDLHSVPMFRYKWPLEIDAKKVLKEYKEGKHTIKPITLDNTTITLYPHSKHCKANTLVTVLIKTRVEDRYNRDLLRRTWIQDLYTHGLQHSFLLGQCSSKKCQADLDSEMADHKDLVQGNFIDSYYNNTIKFRIGLRYIAYRCNTTRYMLMIDGDYSLNVVMLVQYLKDTRYPKNLFAGKVWPGSRPFRNSSHSHYMSFEFYPFRLLPPFVAAGASLMSVEIIEPMDIIAKFTQFVKFDDVFYAMVARKLDIPLVDISKLIPSWTIPKLEQVELHRRIIGSHRFGNLTEVELIHRIIHGL